MHLQPVDVDALANSLDKPFVMVPVATVDNFEVYIYLNVGAVAQHSHPTQDELFYCHSGLLILNTDWGVVHLASHECAVVPRGVAHVSASMMRTIVLFFQDHGDPERKNGRGRLASGQGGPLEKLSVLREAARAESPLVPRRLATVDDMSLRVIRAEGSTPWHGHPECDEMIYAVNGQVSIDTEAGGLPLEAGQMVVIPHGLAHRLDSPQQSVLVSLIHNRVPPVEQMGFRG